MIKTNISWRKLCGLAVPVLIALAFGILVTSGDAATTQSVSGSPGLLYLHHRSFDPDTGRFISPDPLIPTRANIGMNRFDYGYNAPTNFTDRSGMAALGVAEVKSALMYLARLVGRNRMRMIKFKVNPYRHESDALDKYELIDGLFCHCRDAVRSYQVGDDARYQALLDLIKRNVNRGDGMFARETVHPPEIPHQEGSLMDVDLEQALQQPVDPDVFVGMSDFGGDWYKLKLLLEGDGEAGQSIVSYSLGASAASLAGLYIYNHAPQFWKQPQRSQSYTNRTGKVGGPGTNAGRPPNYVATPTPPPSNVVIVDPDQEDTSDNCRVLPYPGRNAC